jgi:hypothetical protein
MSDFFNKLDSKIEEKNQQKQTTKLNVEETKQFFKNEISELASIIKDYVEKCVARGINASCSVNEYSFSFTVKNKNGFFLTEIFSQSDNPLYFEFVSEFMDDNRKKYRSKSGMTYTENNWDQGVAVNKIEKTINDFMFYIDRHGGL